VLAGPDYFGVKQAIQPPAVAQAESLSFAELQQVDRRVDSLLPYLQEHAGDVDAMLAIARIYTDHGWAGEAIGPLARALQLDPYRRDLWVALDRALDKMGREKITDAELTRAALEFVSAFEMLGHGC
jgi:cytochrome c-type biogenesis protein CcmH/NrfG